MRHTTLHNYFWFTGCSNCDAQVVVHAEFPINEEHITGGTCPLCNTDLDGWNEG